jgi:hypothetical protein
LLLCALPYHDTHTFVRIVQLVNLGWVSETLSSWFITRLLPLSFYIVHSLLAWWSLFRNSKWAFLNGVKSSGAAPPRSVIVQQCIRDNSLLETLSNYVSFYCCRIISLAFGALCLMFFFVTGYTDKGFPSLKDSRLLLHSSDCGVLRSYPQDWFGYSAEGVGICVWLA